MKSHPLLLWPILLLILPAMFSGLLENTPASSSVSQKNEKAQVENTSEPPATLPPPATILPTPAAATIRPPQPSLQENRFPTEK